MSTPTPPVPRNRRPSRSNSVSSPVLPIQKSASVSSRGGPRTSYLRNRSTSPDSISRVLHSLNNSRSDYRNRLDTHESKKPSGLNGNRWSHSTSSSLSAIDTDLIRKRTSSIRKSVGAGYSPNGMAPSSHPYAASDTKYDARGSPKRNSVRSPAGTRTSGSRLAFTDSSNLKIVQDLSQSSNVAGPADFFSSAWEPGSMLNKFGEPVQSLSIHYTTTGPSSTVQSSDAADANADPRSRADRKMKSSRGQRRDHSTNGSRDIITANAASPARKEPSRDKDLKSPRRKDMLSKALAKANQAVLLDNAQNINAAIEAYNEACELLQQVMICSPDLEDRKKLSQIKASYSDRIAELHDLDKSFVELLDRDDSPSDEYDQPEEFYHEDASYQANASLNAPVLRLPLRQESLLPEIFGGDNYLQDRSLPSVRNPIRNSTLNVPMDAQLMPQPLSPKPATSSYSEDQELTPRPGESQEHNQQASLGPRVTSWLDTPDKRSSKTSSRLSSIDIDRKDDHLFSAIEAEFDAMNAAVDSAYDDEIDQESTPRIAEAKPDGLPTVEDSDSSDHSDQVTPQNRYDPIAQAYLDDEAEEEERMLEEINDDFDATRVDSRQNSMSELPRQSDSSGFSGRTWGSSMGSTTATTRTTLSTLAEAFEPPLHAPPTGALPEPPQSSSETTDPDVKLASRPSFEKHVGIRDRRMSGQSAQQLKIETFARRNSLAQQTQPPAAQPAPPSVEEPEASEELPLRALVPAASFSSSLSSVQPSTPLLSTHSGETPQYESPATPALLQGASAEDGPLLPPSPSRQGKMLPPPPGPIVRKNVSSSSLAKGSLSINTSAADADLPMTPGSAVFPKDSRDVQSATTPATSAAGGNLLTTTASGGMYLFDDLTSAPQRPGSPRQTSGYPTPLEPCPESFLLRPFWLMRCLYQALSHPRGGFVSTKLFIPRDIWRVKGIKIKALDDKIAQCDLLSAALQKLARVDTLDADAVLEELQSFETILEQVRSALSKKLGSDVGLSGSASAFRSPAGEDATDPLASKATNASSAAKSIASGWRKLRSKSSSAALASNARHESPSQSITIASLPMTSSASVTTSRSHLNARNRNPPPTPSALPQLLSSHAYYISSLARLCDAVQVLDSIARQAEDPGLKCSSKTHVGLELSVRNAAEFFAFYIIRFVMSDILMLLDKFLKRGGEWAMT